MTKSTSLRMAILSQISLVSTLTLAAVGYWNASVTEPAPPAAVSLDSAPAGHPPPRVERVALSVSLAPEEALLPTQVDSDAWEELDNAQSIFRHFRDRLPADTGTPSSPAAR